MCIGEGCETQEKIREWLSGRFIMLLYNSKSFLAEKYYEEAVVFESLISYVPISSQIREIIPFKVEMTHL